MSTSRLRRPIPMDKMERGPSGRRLCRQCKTEVPRGRLTFCGDVCVDAYKIESGHSIRHYVKQRDHGVCGRCGLDTEAVERYLRALWVETKEHHWMITQRDELREWLDAAFSGLMERVAYFAKLGFPVGLARWGLTIRSSFWHADHIVPVVDGGGTCGLENLRTLCVPCHKAVTAEWRRQRSRARA